jgi:hypothetical protein
MTESLGGIQGGSLSVDKSDSRFRATQGEQSSNNNIQPNHYSINLIEVAELDAKYVSHTSRA